METPSASNRRTDETLAEAIISMAAKRKVIIMMNTDKIEVEEILHALSVVNGDFYGKVSIRTLQWMSCVGLIILNDSVDNSSLTKLGESYLNSYAYSW